jgi:hypothetical protein
LRRAQRPWPEESNLLERAADGEQPQRLWRRFIRRLPEATQRMKRDHRAKAVREYLNRVAAIVPRARQLRVKTPQDLERTPFALDDRSHVVRDIGDDRVQHLIDQGRRVCGEAGVGARPLERGKVLLAHPFFKRLEPRPVEDLREESGTDVHQVCDRRERNQRDYAPPDEGRGVLGR